MASFIVWGLVTTENSSDYRVIDTVYFDDSYTTEDVKESLVNRDSYDPEILIERE